MRFKKCIIVIISILLLLMLVLAGYEITIRIDGKLDKSNQMSRDEILELVKKDYNNYSLIFGEQFSQKTTKIFVKDNVVKKMAGNKCYEYSNYNTDERIDCLLYPLAYISSAKEYNTDEHYKKAQMHGLSYYDITDENKYDFEYLGEKDVNGRKTIVIKLIETQGTKDYYKYYIDKETGIIVGEEFYYHIFGIILIKVPNYMKVEFDCVTNEDVKRPNIIGYIIMDFRELNTEE